MNHFRVFFVFLFFLASCTVSEHAPKKTLKLNLSADPYTLDSRQVNDLTASNLQGLLFEGLLALNQDPTKPAELRLAKSISVSKDQKTYTFHLRKAKWSNGDPITSYDFEYAWKSSLAPSFPAPNAHLLYPILNAEKVKLGLIPPDALGIKTPDPKTLVIKLHSPTPYFLELAATYPLAPRSKKSEDHLVTNGPFLLTKWSHNDKLILKKNPHYWDAENVHLDKIRITIIDNPTTALHLFETGQLDALGLPFSPIPSEAIPRLAKKNLLHTTPIAATIFCNFNTAAPPFNNANIRKAFTYAIDKKNLVENLLPLEHSVATSILPSFLTHQKENDFYPHQSQAREYLKKGIEELGWQASSLQEITYAYVGGSAAMEQIAQELQQQWNQKLGIRIKLVKLEKKLFFETLSQRNFSIASSLWLAQFHDPISYLDRLSSKQNIKNYTGWENPTFAALLQSSYSSSLQKRPQILKAAEQIVVDECPLFPLCHMNCTYLVQPYVKNFHPFSLRETFIMEK